MAAGILILVGFAARRFRPVAVATLSLAVLSCGPSGDTLGPLPVQAQDDQTPARSLVDIRARAEAGDAEAQKNLGEYAIGEGMPQDDAEAVAWFRKASEQGNARAQYNLGVSYYNGLGVPQDYVEAVAWFRKAAEQGDAEAQYNLGVSYDIGLGVPQDYVEAVAWYRRGAEQGAARAQYNLGLMYAEGKGVQQDDIEAHMWLNLVASRRTGAWRERPVDDRARRERAAYVSVMEPSALQAAYLRARNDVATKMTPADLIEAQRRAREWNAAHPVP